MQLAVDEEEENTGAFFFSFSYIVCMCQTQFSLLKSGTLHTTAPVNVCHALHLSVVM